MRITSSPTGESVLLDWSSYNELAQADVVGYRIYLAKSPFTSVEGVTPFVTLPASTYSLQLTNLPVWEDRYFAVVAEDALGGYERGVNYSASYVIAPEVVSREFSIFVGGTTTPTFGEISSREISVLATTPAPPDRLTELRIDFSPTGDRASLDWSGYNELAQQDVVRYDIYVSDRAFRSVAGVSPTLSVPAGDPFHVFTNLPPWKDRYFAVVAVDALEGFDTEVNYAAGYVLARETVSREFSIFVGSTTDPTYGEVVSREISLLVPDGTTPVPVTGPDSGFKADTSTSAFSAIDLDWSSYNELAQRDVLRYRVYIASSFFTNVSGMEPYEFAPAGIPKHTVGRLHGGDIYYVAAVAEDVLGNFNPAVYSISVKASIGALGEIRNLVVTSSADSLRFDWAPPQEVDAFLKEFHVYFGTDPKPIVILPGTTRYEATGLPRAKGFPFRVSTVDTFRTESAGISVLAATWLPNPTNVTAQSFDQRARLSWTHAEPNELVKHYAVYRSPTSFNSVAGMTPILTTRERRVDVPDLVNGKAEFFAVTTVTLVGGEDPVVRAISLVPETVSGSFADLAVSNVVAPVAAFQGQTIEVSWSTRNVGTGATSVRSGVPVTSWVDRLVLSPDLVFGDADDVLLADVLHTGSLTVGAGYQGFAAVRVPTNLFGIYHLAVLVNVDGLVYEHLDVSSNLSRASQPLQIALGSVPAITLQPTNIAIHAYSSGQLVAGVTGSPLPTLQWRMNGIPLAGQTNATLSFTNAQPWQAGEYELVADNAIGSVSSAQVVVWVLPALNPLCLPAPLGLVGWWPGDGNANDLVGGNHGDLLNGAAFAPGVVSSALVFDGVNDYISVGNPAALRFSGNQPFSVEGWLKPEGFGYIISKFNHHVEGEWIISVGGDGRIGFQREIFPYHLTGKQALPFGQFSHFAAVYDGTWMRIFVNGQFDVQTDQIRSSRSANNTPVLIGAFLENGSPSGFFRGVIDELAIWSRALSSNEIAAIYAAGSAGMCKPKVPPSIISQPADLSVFATAPVEIAVQAVGDEPLRFQWRFNGVPLSAQTNASLSLGATQPAMAGLYDVIVRNPLGSVTSRVARLVVRTDISDLAARSLSAASALLAGQPTPIAFSVTNQGSGIASAPWSVELFLASNLSGSDIRSIGTFSLNTSLAAGASLSRTQQVIVPVGLVGTWFPGIRIDPQAQVFETNRANNLLLLQQPVAITAPDLQIVSVDAAPDALFGSDFQVRWVVRNSGNGSTYVSWRDDILLSRSSTPGADSLRLHVFPQERTLAPGESYTNRTLVRLPLQSDYVPGTYFMAVRVDAAGAQSEADESNNTASRGVQLNFPPRPDLTPRFVSVSTNVLPSEAVTWIWSVTNRGPAATRSGWTDSLYLSNSSSGLQLLASLTQTTPLSAGASIVLTQQAVIPISGPSGDLTAWVRSDSGEEVLEEDESNNIAASILTTRVPSALSLSLSAHEIPEDAPSEILAVVTRNGSRSGSLSLRFRISNTNEVQMASGLTPIATGVEGFADYLLTIPSGQPSIVVRLRAIQDAKVDANKQVQIGAIAEGFLAGVGTVTVINVDLPALVLGPTEANLVEGQKLVLSVSRGVAEASELRVAINSSNPAQLSPPAFITIPGGAASVDFEVVSVDDNRAEALGGYTLTVSASGYMPASATVAVSDNDVPALVVSLSAASVAEGAGSQAITMTVTRDPVGNGSINFEPTSSDPALVITPIQITLPAGQASRSFPLTIRDDDGSVNDPRLVTLDARVLAFGSGVPLPTISTPASLQVTDNDGPTLKVTLAQKLVLEGRDPATIGTVSRNTATTTALDVTLASSLDTEASVPVKVVIPVGERSATFPIRTYNDNRPDGNQSVVILASALGYNSGSETLVVSDRDLPDLIPGEASFPLEATPGQRVRITYRIFNQGIAPAQPPFRTRVYLSRDAVYGDDSLITQTLHTNAIPVGLFVEMGEQVDLPLETGPYWVVIETDSEQLLAETLEDNNVSVSSHPIQLTADYGAWVEVQGDVFLPGRPVRMSGVATNGAGGLMPDRNVLVRVKVRGIERSLTARADTAGQFSTVFQPLVNEGGRYEVAAMHPAVRHFAVQDRFIVVGMKAEPNSSSFGLLEGQTRDVRISLKNLSDVPLKRLAVEVVAKPADLVVLPSLSETELVTQAALTVRFTATTASAYGTVHLRVRTEEGLAEDIYFGVSVEPLHPRLVSFPPSLYSAMAVGGQTVVEFDVVNHGGKTSGPVTLSLPPITWIRMASTNPMPSLAPGETNRVTLLLSPPRDLDLTLHTGSLALNSPESGLAVPFSFRAMSQCLGSIEVEAVDEFTYYAEGSPRVTNAVVTLRDPLSNTNVLVRSVNLQGRLVVDDLPEGYYDVQVTAEKHQPYRATHLIRGGITNDVQAFLSRQVVTYNWTVEPVEIEDRYRITIESVFETVVPVPVVIVEPGLIDLDEITGNEATVDVKITNKGLLAAQAGRISFGTHPRWEVRPVVEDLGAIPASTSITVPVRVRRLASASAPSPRLADTSDDGPCSFGGAVYWQLVCGNRTNTYCAGIAIINSAKGCGGGGIPWGIGGGGPGNGSPGAPYASSIRFQRPFLCAECDEETFKTKCLEAGLSFDIAALKSTLLEAFNKAAPPVIELVDMKLTFDVKGSICTCCSEGESGYQGSISANVKAQFIVRLGANIPNLLKGIKIQHETLGEVEVELRPFGGVEFALEGYATGKCEAECFFGTRKCCYQAGITISATPQLSASATFKAKLGEKECSAVGSGSIYITLKGKAQVSNCETNATTACYEDVKAGINVSGSIGCDGKNFSIAYSEEITVMCGNCPDSCKKPSPAPQDISNLDLSQELANAFESGWGISGRPNGVAELLYNRFPNELAPSDGICARVKIRLEQEAVIARDAFRGTLEVDNDGPTRLENVGADVIVRTESGVLVDTNLFAIRLESTSGISAVDGAGILPASSSGTARWLIIPTVDAAPTVPTRFLVGGSLRYRQDGKDVIVPLVDVPITVLPSPRLTLKYFHQRDVFSDDPFTPVIEPMVPYGLAVLVQNRGYGNAKRFRITSAQPKIVENEKGLLIDFNIIATEVAGQSVSPSLTVNFGDIGAGQSAIGRWLLTSTLQGLFIDYKATWEHIDGFGNARLSLIDEVTIHEMLHQVQADRGFEDGKPDFLVNQVDDFRDLPDTLYLSDGRTNRVDVVLEGTHDGPVTATDRQVEIEALMPSGWSYLRMPDPGQGEYRLARVLRPDGSAVALLTNVWTTDRTFIGMGKRPIRENILHLLDYNSPGRYTLIYEPGSLLINDTHAPISQVQPLAAQSRPYFQVGWSGKDQGELGQALSGIAYYDIYVAENDRPFIPWLTNSTLVSSTYIGKFGSRYAFYSVATDANGNREGAPGAPDAETVVSITNRPPTISIPSTVVINEGEFLSVPYEVSDPDNNQLPGINTEGPVPPGLRIDSSISRLVWQTSEAHGPSSNTIRLIVRDNDFDSLSATGAITVIVREINSAPTLAAIRDYTINEGQLLTINTLGADGDVPSQILRYRLGVGAPANAGLDERTGAFQWRPTQIQGGRTNAFTFLLSDDGIPSLTATQRFKVIVRDSQGDFALNLGSTELFVGETGRIGIGLETPTPLLSSTFATSYDTERLEDIRLVDLAGNVLASSIVPGASNTLLLSFSAFPDSPFVGKQVLGALQMRAFPDAQSGIARFGVGAASAFTLDQQFLPRPSVTAGRVVVVNEAPVLEALLSSNLTRRLVLHGHPGRLYHIEAADGSLVSAVWSRVDSIRLTSRSQVLPAHPHLEKTQWFRAVQDESLTLGASWTGSPGSSWVLSIEPVRPGSRYVIQASRDFAVWVNQQTNAATTPVLKVTNAIPRSAGHQFFRALEIP